MEYSDTTRVCQPSNAKLLIPYKLKFILEGLAKNNPLEWQCFGEVEEVVGNKFRVTKLIFPKQTNGQTTTSVTEEDSTEAMKSFNYDKLFCWIHSHNTMGVFWSGTDFTQMDRQRTDNGLHTFSLVVNARGDSKAALNMSRPIEGNFDMEVVTEFPEIDDAVLQDAQSILDSVQEEEKIATYPRYGAHQQDWEKKSWPKPAKYNRNNKYWNPSEGEFQWGGD